MFSCSKTQSRGNGKSQLEPGPTNLVPSSLKQTLVFPIQQFAVLNTSKAGRQAGRQKQTHGGIYTYICDVLDTRRGGSLNLDKLF